jgi:hypothetical protein
MGTNSTAKPLALSYNKSNNANEEYLIMLESRKPSKLPERKQANDRDSNYS